jgi:hypothetical protein
MANFHPATLGLTNFDSRPLGSREASAMCIDEKGVYWETLSSMARHYGREHDLIQLQIRADDTDAQWTPPNRNNLTGDRSIPFTTYAKFIVDTATSLGQGGDKGFFKSQA